MIRAMVIMILAGLTFLQSLPDGMAPNPFAYEFCPERYLPKLIPNPSISPTPSQPRKVTPEPTVEATLTPEVSPTPESWTCPAIGDLKRGQYKQVCRAECKLWGLGNCKAECDDCWEE